MMLSTHRIYGDSNDSCTICLEEMSEGHLVLSLLCGNQGNHHTFHYECIVKWVKKKMLAKETVFCPLCKEEINTVMFIREQGEEIRETCALNFLHKFLCGWLHFIIFIFVFSLVGSMCLIMIAYRKL